MIFLDDDSVKIGGVILPGIYKSLEVDHEAIIDEQDVEGSSKKPKQVSGYDDAKVTLEILLEDSETITKEEKLKKVQELFKNNHEKPEVYALVSTHAAIRGIKNVVLSKMNSKEDNKKNQITVNLELLQYDTMTITATKAGAGATEDESTSTLTNSYKDYAKNDRGNAPKQKNKTGNSPAIDKTQYR